MIRRMLPLVLAAAGVLAAQDPPGRVGRLSYISGAVSFDPAGTTDWVEAQVNRPLTIGDQLYADNGALAEVEIPGTFFRLGSHTAFQFLNLDDRMAQVRLSEGTLDVHVPHLFGGVEVDTPNQAFTITRPGDYRIDTNPDTNQSYITVRNGEGQVTGTGGAFTVHAGQQAVVDGQDQNAQYNVYQAPAPDEFDNWALSRDHRDERYARSRYMSDEMVGYQDLDQYGSWRTVPDYGQVWVPSVAAGWAPYHDGHWAWVDPWGWTWVDDEPWGFAPFHYGRWAFVNGFWGWCPGPVAVAPVYAPALVAWVGFGGGFGVSLGFGSVGGVGWFPLGPRDVYIPSYGASANYVTRINTSNTTIINNTTITNVYNNYTRTGAVPVTSYMNRTAPNAVVAVPQNALTSARPVQQVAKVVPAAKLTAVTTAMPAPKVAPQVASILGRPAAANAPRPPAAVISRPIVAKATPPPPPAPVQQRLTALARTPGKPLPIAQQHQMAKAAPAAAAIRPPVRVVSQAKTVTPKVVNAPAPRPGTAAQNAPRPGQPAPAAGQPAPAPRPGTAAQNAPRPGQPAPATRPGQPAPAPRAAQTPPARPYEPPSAQRPGTQTRAAQPTPQPQPRATQPQPRTAQTPPNRGNQPPARPAAQPPARTQATAPRSYEPPAARTQQPAPAPQAERQPTPQPRVTTPPQRAQQAPPARPAPPAQTQRQPTPQRAYQPPAREQQPRAQAPAPRPAPAPQRVEQAPPRPAPAPQRAQQAPPRPAPARPAPPAQAQRQAPPRPQGQASRSAPPEKKQEEHR